MPKTQYKTLLAALNLTTFAIMGWVLWLCRYGMDFTDEGFYLVWAADPFTYGVSSTQFGFIYHPLYWLLGGDIALLRQSNMLLTFGSAWLLTHATFSMLLKAVPLSAYQSVSLSIGLALAVLLVFRTWLPSPSYNHLTIQALCLATTGLIWASKEKTGKSLFGWGLVGVGEWLLFLAKPTSALAFACFAAIYVLFARKFRVSLIAMSVAIATILLALTAVLLDGSVQAFVLRLRDGAQMYTTLGAGHLMVLRLEPLVLDPAIKQALWGLTASVLVVLVLNGVSSQIPNVVGSILLVCLAVLSGLMIAGMHSAPFHIGSMQELLVASIPFGMLLAAVTLHRGALLHALQLPELALALLLIVLPYAFVFGTNANYWSTASHAAIFWLLAGLVFLRFPSDPAKTARIYLASVFCIQLLVVLQLHNATVAPYRQMEALRQQHTPVTLPGTGSELLLGEGYGRYVNDVVALTKQAGLKPGTPVIDLTGHSPMVLHIMEAQSIGQPWTVGGYPGSINLAVRMLARVDCKRLAQAWLLTEPDGPRKLPPEELLSAFGANFDADYTTVGHLSTPPGKGSYPGTYSQALRKPNRPLDSATQACLHARTPS